MKVLSSSLAGIGLLRISINIQETSLSSVRHMRTPVPAPFWGIKYGHIWDFSVCLIVSNFRVLPCNLLQRISKENRVFVLLLSVKTKVIRRKMSELRCHHPRWYRALLSSFLKLGKPRAKLNKAVAGDCVCVAGRGSGTDSHKRPRFQVCCILAMVKLAFKHL